jgi:hypothetical protein
MTIMMSFKTVYLVLSSKGTLLQFQTEQAGDLERWLGLLGRRLKMILKVQKVILLS